MNGQMKNYKCYLENTYTPIDVNSLPEFFDMRAMREYSRKTGILMADLSENEKANFLIPNPTAKKASNL